MGLVVLVVLVVLAASYGTCSSCGPRSGGMLGELRQV